MRVLVVSSSLDGASRSERVGAKFAEALGSLGSMCDVISLKDHPLPRFDNGSALADDANYKTLHELTLRADGLVLCSPVYNWTLSAELKQFIEAVGTTPPDGSLRGAFFDKIVTFVAAAGLAHSYMAFSSLAMSMMLDFKCIINPYQVYVHNRHWNGDELSSDMVRRIDKSADVMVQLMRGLSSRTYRSDWEM
jgi:FMN reductase